MTVNSIDLALLLHSYLLHRVSRQRPATLVPNLLPTAIRPSSKGFASYGHSEMRTSLLRSVHLVARYPAPNCLVLSFTQLSEVSRFDCRQVYIPVGGERTAHHIR